MWHYHPKGYAAHIDWNGGEKRHTLMQNFIKGVERGVDHKDGDGLNNQRSNLRLATKSQNGANRRKNRNSASMYKGVVRYKPKKYKDSWRAQITVNGKKYFSGQVSKERWAAYLYDFAAQEAFGKFARLNFPKGKTVF